MAVGGRRGHGEYRAGVDVRDQAAANTWGVHMTSTSPHQEPIRVGVVGLSASGGWAATAHVPALAGLEGYELRARAGRRLPRLQFLEQ
jgi:hypothetical protein